MGVSDAGSTELKDLGPEAFVLDVLEWKATSNKHLKILVSKLFDLLMD